MKKLLVAGAVAIAALAAILVVLLSNLDAIVAKAIEKHGGAATGTKVSVSGVHIALREGRGTIRGLRVASPDGYAERTAFALDDITVGIDAGSVRGDPVIIDEIRVRAPVVNAELTRTGGSNLDDLRRRLQAAAPPDAGGGAATKRIRIRRFVFEQGRIEADASALGLGRRTLALPEIRLNDVGGAGGAPPEEIARAIVTAFAGRAATEIAGSEFNRLVRDKVGGAVTEKAKGLLDKLVK